MGTKAFNVTVLDSGLTVVTDYLPEAKTVSPFWQLLSGSNRDLQGAEGAAHFFEHLLGSGHKQDLGFDLRHLEERWAADMRLATSAETTFLSTTILPRRISEFISSAGSMVCHALLEKEEVERQRAIIRQEYFERKADPKTAYYTEALSHLYGDKAFSRPIIGSLDTIMTISKDDLERYRENFYLSEDMVFGVSGPVPHEHVVKLVDLAFKDVRRGKNTSPPETPFVHAPQVWLSGVQNQKVGIAMDLGEQGAGLKPGIDDLRRFVAGPLGHHLRDAGITYGSNWEVNEYQAGAFLSISFDTEPDIAQKGLRHLEEFFATGKAFITPERHAALTERDEMDGYINDVQTEVRSNTIKAFHKLYGEIQPYEEATRHWKLNDLEVVASAFDHIKGKNARVFTSGPCREVGEFDIKGKANLEPPKPETP